MHQYPRALGFAALSQTPKPAFPIPAAFAPAIANRIRRRADRWADDPGLKSRDPEESAASQAEAKRIREIADTIESPTYDIRNGTRLELVLIGMCLQAHDPIAEEFFQFAKHAGLEAANFRAGGLRHALRR